MALIKKLYGKLQDFTYADILIMTFTTIVVSLIFWIIILPNRDLILGLPAEVIVKDIELCIAIHLAVWLISSAINSMILFIIKKSNHKHTK